MAVAYQYKVEGITCVNCVNGIKSHLNKKHIQKVSIDIPKGIITIYNTDYTALEIEKFISEIGYPAQFFDNEIKQDRCALEQFALSLDLRVKDAKRIRMKTIEAYFRKLIGKRKKVVQQSLFILWAAVSIPK